MNGPGAGRWERPLREHRASIERFLETTARVPAERWSLPLGEGKWSPAQVAEHILLAYEVVLRELNGAQGIRVKVGPVVERLLRWVVLPHILFHRSFPLRARSPRVTTPSADGVPRDLLPGRLRELAEAFERQALARPDETLTHPYFGPLPMPRAVRFVAVHNEHHARQMEPAAPRAR